MTGVSAENRRTGDLVGQTLLGKLRVIARLGEGGMGVVYEVEHLLTRHHRALKVLHTGLAESEETVIRFIREAGVAGTLRSAHVVETFDAGQLEDGSPYVLMELLRGSTFADLLNDAPTTMDVRRVLGIVTQVLEGLSVAHEAGIVHRDIKPENVFVMVGEDGADVVKILDFGISKFRLAREDQPFEGTLTGDHSVMGTPFYMSPEQATGAKNVDRRSDLYSVGVMLYEALSGRLPYDAPNMSRLVLDIHTGRYVALETLAPHLPSGLAHLVERAMHREPDARPPSARALLEELAPFLDTASPALGSSSADAASITAPPRRVSGEAVTLYAEHAEGERAAAPPSSGRRVPGWVPLIGVVVLLTATLGVFALLAGGFGAPPETDVAEVPVEPEPVPIPTPRSTPRSRPVPMAPADPGSNPPVEGVRPDFTDRSDPPAEPSEEPARAPVVTTPRATPTARRGSPRSDPRTEPTGRRRPTKILRDVWR